VNEAKHIARCEKSGRIPNSYVRRHLVSQNFMKNMYKRTPFSDKLPPSALRWQTRTRERCRSSTRLSASVRLKACNCFREIWTSRLHDDDEDAAAPCRHETQSEKESRAELQLNWPAAAWRHLFVHLTVVRCAAAIKLTVNARWAQLVADVSVGDGRQPAVSPAASRRRKMNEWMLTCDKN